MADTEPKTIAESSTRLLDLSTQWKEFQKRKDFAAWANDRSPNKATRARHDLFIALDKYITAHGGWTISVPGAREIKIEVPKGSELPSKLAALGWKPILCGSTTRTTGQGFVPVDILVLEK